VARVFALVVRCRVMRLFVYSRVGKNRDTRRESPAGAGAACAAGHRTVLFGQKILAAQKPMTYNDLLGAGRLDYSHTQPFIIFEKVQIFYFVNEHNVFC
jgi:hypothetical protein